MGELDGATEVMGFDMLTFVVVEDARLPFNGPLSCWTRLSALDCFESRERRERNGPHEEGYVRR